MIFNPQPKEEKPIRLKGAARAKFRAEVFEHFGGICAKCGQYAPLYGWDGVYNPFTCGDVSHIRHHSVGGGDTLDNVKWRHHRCHMERHTKGGKA